MSEMLAAMGQDKSVEALGKIWGERNDMRRTLGSPERSIMLVHNMILADDMGFPDMRDFARDLADVWAGEGGWETQQLIRALQAVKVQTIVQTKEPEKRD